MSRQPDGPKPQDRPRRPRQVRLPGFISDEPVGLGDVIKRATTVVGIKPCSSCAKRAARLNSVVVFTRGSK
jgi:hypothetical protein